jgi:DNA-cytosine methyltransferase
MTLTYGSLFAGVGGFDMGMEQAGYEPVFQVEWDKNCQKILHHHWPTVPKWGDVCDVNGADLPPCDVLIFGSPCQDLSVAGKRAGLQDGDRSSMFFEAVRIIKEMRDATNSIYPRATIWENVPGALSSNKGADFGVVLSSLADIGAITQEYAVLDAQYFGVPQRRRRIFLVSIFDSAASERCPDPLLPLIQGSRGDFAKGRKARKDSSRLIEAGVDSGNGETIGSLSVSDLIKWQTNHQSINAGLLQVVPFVKSRRAQSDTDDETWVEGDVTPTLNAFDNGGESRATVLMPVNMPLSELGPTLTTTYGAKNYSNHQEVMSGSIMPVAYSIREDAKANTFSATETDTALCLNGLVPSTQSHHAQIFIAEPIVYDGYNQKLDDSGIHRSLRIGRDSSDFVAQPIIFENSYRDGPRVGDDICHTLPAKMGLGGGNTPMLAEVTYSFDTQFGSNAAVFEDTSPTLKASQQPPSVSPPGLAVRRLTPLECERLMGWPDDHTRWTADGKEQADTNRYKQCGNGVASPVARWVGEQLRPVLET